MNLLAVLTGKRTPSTAADADHPNLPGQALVPYRAIFVAHCSGKIGTESTEGTLMLPTHAISAIYYGNDKNARDSAGFYLDMGRTYREEHTFLLRGWTRDWRSSILISETDLDVEGVVASVKDPRRWKRVEGFTIDINPVCGIALVDGRLFQSVRELNHYQNQRRDFYNNDLNQLLACARGAFAPTIGSKDKGKKAS
jgi:hypothetical protein